MSLPGLRWAKAKAIDSCWKVNFLLHLYPYVRDDIHIQIQQKIISWDFQVKLELQKTKIEIKRRSKLPDTAMETPQDALCGNRRWLLACKCWFDDRLRFAVLVVRCLARLAIPSSHSPQISSWRGHMNRSSIWDMGLDVVLYVYVFSLPWIISLESKPPHATCNTASMTEMVCFRDSSQYTPRARFLWGVT